MRRVLPLLLAVLAAAAQDAAPPKPRLWSLQPVTRPAVPAGAAHPIDAFLDAALAKRGLRPAPPADKATLFRRLHLDLTGLPPDPAALAAFLADPAPDAYEKTVDRLLADPQHAVRYARHWLDVLGYADVDGGLLNEPGMYLWRDWVIRALDQDLPYDQFVRASLMGDQSARPEDLFATGFLLRATRQAADSAEGIAFNAVESTGSAFLGLTLGCAKCHDHMYDPVSQRDYYAMKALFDPLVPEKRLLATPDELFAHPAVLAKWKAALDAFQVRMDAITRPYEKQMFEERMSFLPKDVEAVFRKDPAARTEAERKIIKDYETVVVPDARKFRDVMKPDEVERYESLRQQQVQLRRDPPTLASFWTVRLAGERLARKSHVYGGGERSRPGDEVAPGFPFAPPGLAFPGDRREPFVKWLTAPGNPLLARVAVNRLWQWHFGEGLVSTPSDFGVMGQRPSHPALLDWLAAEFTERRFGMKAIHRLIVTSAAYRRASAMPDEAANRAIDPSLRLLWKFPVRRLEAETIRDSLLAVAGTLDLTVGGRSFRGEDIAERRVMSAARTGHYDTRSSRRGLYLGRGSDASMNMMPAFLSLFDAEDGHVSCARRERSVTAPQVLFFMNGPLAQESARRVAARLAGPDPVSTGYRLVLGRDPRPAERDTAQTYLRDGSLEGFAWMLLNLSEFVFLP